MIAQLVGTELQGSQGSQGHKKGVQQHVIMQPDMKGIWAWATSHGAYVEMAVLAAWAAVHPQSLHRRTGQTAA